jgi:hypothetical protein
MTTIAVRILIAIGAAAVTAAVLMRLLMPPPCVHESLPFCSFSKCWRTCLDNEAR